LVIGATKGGGVVDTVRLFYKIGNMEENSAVASLAALAQPVRLRVFRALVGAGPEGMNPGALATILGVPSSTLSFHLKELVHSGLVTQERDGRNLIYRPSLDRMAALMDYLTAHCCLGAGCEELDARACKDC
jgi:ArsR family transcriptional regulator, arsenate/arsenite/antimonite-responsive transcriptional repressor